jgi:NAD(P)-dependent dehydrogenase (short-subunit alcohol dehydrogenase family)
LGPSVAAKAGVDALTDSLRIETAPGGARVGCAYFGFIDTDLVRASFAQPSTQRLNDRSPGFLRNPVPVSKAIDAIEQGIERRAARLWAPRWVGPMIALRSALQPFIERNFLKDQSALLEGMRAAEAAHEADTQDPLLGVAMQAVSDRP